jgi:hypothetical protein
MHITATWTCLNSRLGAGLDSSSVSDMLEGVVNRELLVRHRGSGGQKSLTSSWSLGIQR